MVFGYWTTDIACEVDDAFILGSSYHDINVCRKISITQHGGRVVRQEGSLQVGGVDHRHPGGPGVVGNRMSNIAYLS